MFKSVNRKKALAFVGAVIFVVAMFFVGKGIGKAIKNNPRVHELSSAGIADTEDVVLVAHRGMSALAPENTVAAIDKAAEMGYKYVEIDIRKTKDGIWVLSHDNDIKRTTSGEGIISEFTYKQLTTYRIDNGSNVKEYDALIIPTLDEVLKRCSYYGISPVIEIKESGTDFIDELIEFIGYRCNGEVTIISFDREQVEKAYAAIQSAESPLDPQLTEVRWLTKNLNNETLEKAKQNKNIAVSFNGNEDVGKKEIDAFLAENIKLAAWTIDKPSRLEKLYSWGIRNFTTNSIVYSSAKEAGTQ